MLILLFLGLWPAPVFRLQHLVVRGLARRRGPRHGGRHPRHLLHALQPQEAVECRHQQPQVTGKYF